MPQFLLQSTYADDLGVHYFDFFNSKVCFFRGFHVCELKRWFGLNIFPISSAYAERRSSELNSGLVVAV